MTLKKHIYDQVREFIKENPMDVYHDSCEVCDSAPLVNISHKDRYGLPVRFQMCPVCSLATINPRWTDENYEVFYRKFYRDLVSHYNKKNGTANDSYDRKVIQLRISKLIVDMRLDHLMPMSPNVLEIGGGVGDVAQIFRDRFDAMVTIVEPNLSEAEVAESKGFEVIPKTIENSVDSLQKNSFDVVVILRTVDHFSDASVAFAHIRQLMKDDAVLLLDGVDLYKKALNSGLLTKHLKIDHCYNFSTLNLCALLDKHGLTPQTIDHGSSDHIVVMARAKKPRALPDTFYTRLWESGGSGLALWEFQTRGPQLWKVIKTEISNFGKVIARKMRPGKH